MSAPGPVPCLPPRLVFLAAGFLAFAAALFFSLLAGSEPALALRDAMIGGFALAWIAKFVAVALNTTFAMAAHKEAEAAAEAAAEAELAAEKAEKE